MPDILEASITVLYRVISHSQYTLPSADLSDLEQVVRLIRRLRTLGLSTGGSIEVPLKELVDEAKMAAGRQEQGNTGLDGGGIPMSNPENGANGINTVDDFIKRIVDGANCGNADNWV